MNTPTRSILSGAAILFLACTRSAAVTQAEGVQWFSYTNIISATGSLLGVRFIARATALDITSGVTFSVQERDPDGNDVLLDIGLPWTSPYPPIGTEIRVIADYRLECNDGSLVADYVAQWFVSWCDPQLGTQVRSANSGIARTIGASEPEGFEFVLVDENGIEAPGPTPEDAYACAPGSVSAAQPIVFATPYDLVQQGVSVASETPLFPRRDPSIQAESAGTIQLSFDLMGQDACGEIPVGTASTLYVVARAAGPALCGITGAELRVVGMPAGWLANASIPQNAISLGNPLGPVGGNMAYTTCQSPAAGPVLLYTLSVIATTTVADHELEITARTPPASPEFDCPLVVLCDAPIYTIVCMTESHALINPSSNTSCVIPTVGVESHSWTAVKDLYR